MYLSDIKIPKRISNKIQIINPSHELLIRNVKTYVFEKLRNIKKNNVKRVYFLGSCARKTYLRPREYDFFLYFPNESDFNFDTYVSEIAEIFKPELKNVLIKNRGFPYVTLDILYNNQKIIIDMVPYFRKVPYGPIDRTVLHHKYVMSKITPEKISEIRKLKYLLKRVGLYNASTEIRGFSGYCCEILILRYEKIELIPPDLETLEDPCDLSRNLLASVSLENLKRFHILNQNKFKTLKNIRSPVANLYVWRDPPLKAINSVRNHRNVVNAIYYNKMILAELMPYKTIVKYIPYDNEFWKENNSHQSVYHSTKQNIKIIKIQSFLMTYHEFVLVENSCKVLNKTYNYFK